VRTDLLKLLLQFYLLHLWINLTLLLLRFIKSPFLIFFQKVYVLQKLKINKNKLIKKNSNINYLDEFIRLTSFKRNTLEYQ